MSRGGSVEGVVRKLAVVGVLVALPGCRGPVAEAPVRAASPSGASVRLAPDPPGESRFEASGMVLESGDRGPHLCVGAVLDSLPPQCGDVPITNWDWDAVGGEERVGSTIWGDYVVRGTYDGRSFTVTEVLPPGSAEPGEAPPPTPTPCTEPPGGWRVPDPRRTSEEDLDAAVAFARAREDFAGAWVDEGSEDNRSGHVMLGLAFTGDLGRHEAGIRERFGGPLCLVRAEHRYAELERIQGELDGAAQDLGLQLLSSAIDETGNRVDARFVAITDDQHGKLDDRFGRGAVRAEGALRPIA